MKKIVLVNVDFRDAYTGKVHTASDRLEMTDERIAEVKAVNPDFVTVIGVIEDPSTKPEIEDPSTKPETPTAKNPPDKDRNKINKSK